MTTPTADAQFAAELIRQTQHYQQAFAVAEQITAALTARQDVANELTRLSRLMGDVAGFTKAATARQELWKSLGKPPTAHLRAAYDQHTQALQALIDVVRGAENVAVDAQAQLSPQLNKTARDRKVVESYGNAARL